MSSDDPKPEGESSASAATLNPFSLPEIWINHGRRTDDVIKKAFVRVSHRHANGESKVNEAMGH